MNFNKTTIIGVKGNKGSGKDTIASMITYILTRGTTRANYNEWCKVSKMVYNDGHIIHFADKLKDDISTLFKINRNRLNEQDFKENYYYHFNNSDVSSNPNISNYVINNVSDLKDTTLSNVIENYKNNVAIKIRALLQYYGTEVIRNTLWKDAFINYTINEIFKIRNTERFCIIADVRFNNEEEAIVKCGGKIIHICRNNNKSKHESECINESENDYIITNNGSLMALYYSALMFVKEYMI